MRNDNNKIKDKKIISYGFSSHNESGTSFSRPDSARQMPRPILGARGSQQVRHSRERESETSGTQGVMTRALSSVYHPYSYRDESSMTRRSSCDSHQRLYHLRRPLLHSSSGTMRVLIQK
jgi:hypothetical protein